MIMPEHFQSLQGVAAISLLIEFQSALFLCIWILASYILIACPPLRTMRLFLFGDYFHLEFVRILQGWKTVAPLELLMKTFYFCFALCPLLVGLKMSQNVGFLVGTWVKCCNFHFFDSLLFMYVAFLCSMSFSCCSPFIFFLIERWPDCLQSPQ